jgi:hypothetical protein
MTAQVLDLELFPLLYTGAKHCFEGYRWAPSLISEMPACLPDM